jgi:hypothetical protein
MALRAKFANREIGVPGFLRFAANFHLPAAVAFLAFAAAAAGRARNSAPEFVHGSGSAFSWKHSNAVTHRTIPVACGIAIEAQMGGHVAPPSVLAILIWNCLDVKS